MNINHVHWKSPFPNTVADPGFDLEGGGVDFVNEVSGRDLK